MCTRVRMFDRTNPSNSRLFDLATKPHWPIYGEHCGKTLYKDGDSWLLVEKNPSQGDRPTATYETLDEDLAAEYLFENGYRPPPELASKFPLIQTSQPGPPWPPATLARNKWLYEQCCNGVPYKDIIRELQDMPAEWERLSEHSGVKRAARAYARRCDFEDPPIRRRGRAKAK